MTYLAICALCRIHRENGNIMMYASNYRAKLSNLPEISSAYCTASQLPGCRRQNTPLPKIQDQAEKAKRTHWEKPTKHIPANKEQCHYPFEVINNFDFVN